MTLSVKALSASSHTNFQMEFPRYRRKKALNPWIPAMRAAQSSTSTRLRRLVGEGELRQLVVHRQLPHLPAPPSPLISPQVLAQLWGLQGSCSKCRAGPSGVVTTSPLTLIYWHLWDFRFVGLLINYLAESSVPKISPKNPQWILITFLQRAGDRGTTYHTKTSETKCHKQSGTVFQVCF